MNTNTMIMWSVIWISCAIPATVAKDVGIMCIPAIGMFIWWMCK